MTSQVATTAPERTDTLTDWLILHHATGVGSVTLQRLLAVYRGPSDIRRATPDRLRGCGLTQASINALKHPDRQAIERDLDWLEQAGNRIITCQDPDYPPLLAQIPDPPALLYVHGNSGTLKLLQLAVVGSRNPTPSGRHTAREFAEHLAHAGLIITSGLALGIDAASHAGALQAECPTIAVMGTGLDRVYPASHRDLAHRIAARGALVSEYPPGTTPRPENFPRRNRIISGLSLGVLVIEATTRSGSLISARCAGEQGREVFAIPGSIHNPLARGCHALIRQGAKLVETAQDIIDELGTLALAGTQAVPASQPAAPPPTWEPDSEYLELIELIGFEPVSVDSLVSTSGLTPAEVSSMLLQLEMSGFITASPGGLYNRLK